MSKNKFDILNTSEAKEVVGNSALVEKKEVLVEKAKVDFAVKGFPKDLHDAIVANKDTTGNVNAFIRRACMKLAKDEGILN